MFVELQQAMIPLQGMADVKDVNEGNGCSNKMALEYFDTYFFFFGYIPHFLAPLETAYIAIKKYYYYLIELINTLCKGMAWLPFRKCLISESCQNHVTVDI